MPPSALSFWSWAGANRFKAKALLSRKIPPSASRAKIHRVNKFQQNFS